MMCEHEFNPEDDNAFDCSCCVKCAKCRREINLEQQLAAAKAELAAERENRVVTCVYCGMDYPEGTPTSGAVVLTEHIRICEKHPMRELECQLAAANTDLKALKSENELLRHKAAEHDTTMLRAELAAANARVAELEKDNAKQKRLATISRLCKNVQSCRAEKAEQRAEQAEAQCAAMRTAINRYVLENIELLDALKSALEDKP